MIIQTSAEKIGQHGYAHWSGKPTTADAHELLLVPQSIVDGWEGYCSCGEWRAFISFYEIEGRDNLIAEIKRQHAEHIMQATRQR